MKPEDTTGSHVGPGERPIGSRSESLKAVRIVEVTGDLPSMPHIAAQVMDKLSDEDSTPKQIHQLIIKDQALAARVLKVANSPYYGASRSISTLRDAVMFMGFEADQISHYDGGAERHVFERGSFRKASLGTCGRLRPGGPKSRRRGRLPAQRGGLPRRAYARRRQDGALFASPLL